MTDNAPLMAPRVDGARGDEMRRRMQESAASGDCDFCKLIAHSPSRHQNPIVLESEHWIATLNDLPYPGTSYHVLIIAKEHVNDLRELSSEALAEGMSFWVEVADHFGLTGYCPFGRMGDRDLTAQTIPHLHFHITQSDGVAAAIEDVDPDMRNVIFGLPLGMPQDTDALKRLWEAISLWRSALEGKAIGVYPKLSNKAKKPY